MEVKSRRFLSIILMYMIIFTLLLIQPISSTYADEIKIGQINCDLLNVREIPDSNSQISFGLVKDTNVNVIGSYSDWVKISYKTYIGWTKKEFINVQESAVPNEAKVLNSTTNTDAAGNDSAAAGQASSGKSGYVNADDVNFRTSPDVGAEIILKIPQNTQVTAYEENNGFRKCDYSGKTGWVSFDFITIKNDGNSDTNNAAADTGKTPDKAYTKKSAYISGTNVNVRNTPDISGKLVTHMQNNAKVTVIDENSKWCKIQSSDIKGWVSKSYITFNAPKTINSKSSNKSGKSGNSGSNSSSSDSRADTQAIGDSTLASNIISYAKTLLGTRYVYGGMSPSGFDCSGFVCYVYSHFGISLSRSSAAMASNGSYVSKGNLQPGDLVFFDTNRNGTISHVGIYIGNGQYINAASGRQMKVCISSMSDPYALNCYVSACRVL